MDAIMELAAGARANVIAFARQDETSPKMPDGSKADYVLGEKAFKATPLTVRGLLTLGDDADKAMTPLAAEVVTMSGPMHDRETVVVEFNVDPTNGDIYLSMAAGGTKAELESLSAEFGGDADAVPAERLEALILRAVYVLPVAELCHMALHAMFGTTCPSLAQPVGSEGASASPA